MKIMIICLYLVISFLKFGIHVINGGGVIYYACLFSHYDCLVCLEC